MYIHHSTGTLPSSLTKLTGLISILDLSLSKYLGQSGLSGTIPPLPPTTEALVTLDSRISGTVPGNWSNAKSFVAAFSAKGYISGIACASSSNSDEQVLYQAYGVKQTSWLVLHYTMRTSVEHYQLSRMQLRLLA